MPPKRSMHRSTAAAACSGSPALAAMHVDVAADLRGRRLEVGQLPRRQQHRRAGVGVRLRDRPADAPRRAGDQRDLPLQRDLHGRDGTPAIGSLGWSGEPTRRRGQPVPAPARRQPGRLVPVGRRGVRGGGGARRPAPPVGRLLGVPLVPRDGPRELRGRRRRRGDEPALREREGRPRGAARRRRHLHGGHPGHDRPRRLADDGRVHPRRAPVLRRHLLPEGAAAAG